ncbi:MAG: monovalent cation:H+ antiporter-2, family [Chloroflexota bacterium]|nr:monovalent cation:H+ antiporter-2, family [Chloroflexota bacterium]
MTAPLILDIGLVLLAAAGGGWLARRIGLPAVVGYLGVGLVISPFTPGYVADRDQIHLLADVGVALLLFEVGIEIDIDRLRTEHRALLLAAPVQVVITLTASIVALMWAGLTPAAAGLVGLGIASSSSVVIVNITRSKRRTTDPPTERAMLGWSVVQDIVVVVISVVVLGLIGINGRDPVLALVEFGAFVVVAAAVAWLLPRVLTALRGESDLFLLVSVAVALAVAALGDYVFGVPLALAAFVAGLAISEGPTTSEARRRLLPFRDLFAVLFFVAIGSLIEPDALVTALPALALVIALVVVAKVGVSYVLARGGKLPRPLQLAVGLGQVGEFSFVIVSVGVAAGVVPAQWFAATLGAVVLTIAGSAVMARLVGPQREASPTTTSAGL